MKALVLDDGIHWRDVDDARPSPGEALIKVRLAGICRTDLEIARGYMNFVGVLGHEFVGEVVECEEGGWLGKRVVGEINCGCGSCSLCLSGMERHCPDRTVLGIQGRSGSLAEYLTLPVKNLHVVPDAVDDRAAVFTEPLAAALEILEQVRIRPDDRVLVIGDGKLGLLVARVLQIHGCKLLCVGSHGNKMKILDEWGLKSVHYKDYRTELFDVVIEASGSPHGFLTALTSTRPRGTLILKSTYHSALTFDVAPLVVNEIAVTGSRCGPFGPALRLLEQNLLPVQRLISRIYPANEAEAAFDHAAQPGALKVLIDFTGGL